MTNLPEVVWEAAIDLGGVKIKCVVLSDGRRVIPANEMVKVFEFFGVYDNDLAADEDTLREALKKI